MASEMYDRLMADMKSAMKAHDMKAVNAIRGVIARAKDLTVNAGKEMTDEAVVSVVAKGVKQREESIAQFMAAGRAELAEGEKSEMEFLRRDVKERHGARDEGGYDPCQGAGRRQACLQACRRGASMTCAMAGFPSFRFDRRLRGVVSEIGGRMA